MELLQRQRAFFETGATLPLPYRLRQLQRLADGIRTHQPELLAALHTDLGKSAEEAYSTELGMVLSEITHAIRRLASWTRPRVVPPTFAQWPGYGVIYPRPKGVCLILAPWNYPVQLALSPLVACLAAGNCAVVKPSELAPATADALSRLLGDCFDPAYCAAVTGGPDTASALTGLPFDHIFFTGGDRVGRLALQRAAEHLTPVTLELGGKSPCLVEKSANLSLTARRIAWGKVLNAGQTCVAPDLVYVHRSQYQPLVRALTCSFLRFYGPRPHENPEYPSIISQAHLQRLLRLMETGTVLAGGAYDAHTRKLAPTLMTASSSSPLCTEEIFGPLLPILPYDHLEEAVEEINSRPHPLALYLFTEDKRLANKLLAKMPFGGGCVNDTISHLVSPWLPFGGIGASGMGQYHGRWGFDTFTHYQGILSRSTRKDPSFRYPPLTGRMGLFQFALR